MAVFWVLYSSSHTPWGALKTQVLENASTGKRKYGKGKYETAHFARMENASTENASTVQTFSQIKKVWYFAS